LRGDHLCSWNFESTVLYTAQEEGCSKGSHTKLKPHSNPALQHSVPYVEQSKVASPRQQAGARALRIRTIQYGYRGQSPRAHCSKTVRELLDTSNFRQNSATGHSHLAPAFVCSARSRSRRQTAQELSEFAGAACFDWVPETVTPAERPREIAQRRKKKVTARSATTRRTLATAVASSTSI